MLTKEQFPHIDHIIFTHDLLGDEDFVAEIGPLDDVLVEAALVSIPVQTIIDSAWFLPMIAEDLREQDFDVVSHILMSNQNIFVPPTHQDDHNLQVTLAVGVLLESHSRCDPSFELLRAADRRTWVKTESDKLQTWYRDPESSLHLVRCRGPDKNFDPPYVFLSAVGRPHHAPPGFKIRDHRCAACNNSKACTSSEFLEVKTLFDLPFHYARQLWYNERLTVSWAAPRVTKTAKARR
ncbi:hypothetical protein FB451DRAFT_384997 [Mycena latifolia]|nr:hypothetical protein FB451DRAFT_384997 [Mycena latifolia]